MIKIRNYNDLNVSTLTLGCNVFGWSVKEQKTVDTIIDYYLSLGGNVFDTADMYPSWAEGAIGGESETFLGNSLKRYDREKYLIATKVGKRRDYLGLSYKNILNSLDGSLKRLQLDYVDIYYAHTDDFSLEIEEIVSNFYKIFNTGKCRYISLSNFNSQRLKKFISVSPFKILSLQSEYNFIKRNYEDDLLPICIENNIQSMPYYGLAQGFLTGKYSRDSIDQIDSVRRERIKQYIDDNSWRVLDILKMHAKSLSVPISQVALKWLLDRKTVTSVIASVTSIDQLKELDGFDSINIPNDL